MSHAFRIHGIVRQAKYYVTGDAVCRICLRRFATRARAVEHMSQHPKCLVAATRMLAPLSDEEVAAHDEFERGQNRAGRLLGFRRAGTGIPFVQLSGPSVDV